MPLQPSELFDTFGWPVNPVDVGMGPGTRWKLQEYHTLVHAHTAIVRNINSSRVKPFPYIGLDPTSGPGGYVQRQEGELDCQLIGTPLRLARACHEERLSTYRLGFIEQKPKWAALLRKRLDEAAAANKIDLSHIDVIEGDYRHLALPWITKYAPRWGARGLVTPDPNGRFAYETLRGLGRLPQLECVDFALHVTASLLKWHRGRGEIQLTELLKACGKEFWFVGRMHTNWQWVWLFGTNWKDWPDLLRIGLVSFASEAGQARLETLCTTKDELFARQNPKLEL